MTLKAGEDKVIVIPDLRKETTESGLILPVSDDNSVIRGEVVNSDDSKYSSCKVYFSKQFGVPVEIDKVKYFVVDIKNILAYIGL